MNIDPKDLAPLAGALLSAGAPILGGIIGGPVGALVGSLLPQLAGAFGLAPDAAPAQIAAAVQADPNASSKLSAIEEQHKSELAWAQLQVDQNDAAMKIEGPAGLRFFYGGWRPMAGWVLCPVPAVYQVIASAAHLPMLPDNLWALFLPVWVGLAGLRTYERFSGVALDTLAISKIKK
jgi:hypothetical protein